MPTADGNSPWSGGREAGEGVNLRIGYYLHWLDGPESGVFKKVTLQAAAWQSAGCEVRIFLLTKPGPWWNAGDRTVSGTPIASRTYSSVAGRVSAGLRLIGDIGQWEPDVVYWRNPRYLPGCESVLRRVPVVVEINSDDVAEARLRGLLPFAHAVATRGRLLSRTSGLVCVTHELARRSGIARFEKPLCVIPNGLPLEQFETLPPVVHSRPRLAFLGSPKQVWHGVDRLLEWADRDRDIEFDIIGYGSNDLPEGSVVSPNVRLLGILERHQYSSVLAGCDAAVGTLALERKGLSEASPLKVREYLASGLPAIIGYVDSDFREEVPFLLRIDGSSIASERSRISRFLEAWKGRRVPQRDVARIDAFAKEALRLRFLSDVRARWCVR